MSFFSHFNPTSNESTSFQEGLQSLLFLIIRLYFGWAFFQAGVEKFNDIEKVSAFFSTIGIPLSTWTAYLVAAIEAVGGALLMLGLGIRLAAALLFLVMVGAYLTAHFDAVRHLFDTPILFTQQAPFLFLLATLFLFAFGPGKISLDYLLGRCCKR